MATLHLTLKKKWFDLILSGQKTEEYREIKPYWNKRFEKSFNKIQFRNGYSKNAPSFTIELKEILVGLGTVEHGAPENQKVYILKLGKILNN